MARFSIHFVTDIHGSESFFRQFPNAGKFPKDQGRPSEHRPGLRPRDHSGEGC